MLNKITNNQLLNIHQLIKTCIKLTIQACNIIQNQITNNKIKKYLKSIDDPVTQTDYKIQTMFIKGIKNTWNNFTIIAQQNVQYQGELSTNYQSLQSIQLPNDIQFNQQYNLKDTCLWIDPIDNTKGYVQGNYQQVTVLAGISYQQKSQIGVIGIPYQKINPNSPPIYNPSILLGCASTKFAYELSIGKKQWKKIEPPGNEKKTKPRIVLSPSRENIIETMISDDLKGQIIFFGGAGYKAALVARKQADLFPYCQSYTHKWDTCAGEAIIKGLGGYFTDAKGNELIYDPNNKETRNGNGVLCGFVPEYQQAAILRCQKYKKQNSKS